MATETATYTVPGMSCDHCRVAVTEALNEVDGVAHVEVDLSTKRVIVSGADIDDASVRAAIDEAGYTAV